MITSSVDFINVMSSSVKEFFIKLELYDSKMRYLKEITKQVTRDDIGFISIDRERPIRRSFSFALNNYNNEFDWGEDSLIWLDKRVILYTGLRLPNGEIEYIPQGVFIVSQPSNAHTFEGKITYLSGQDKMFLMTDKRGKLLNDLTIEEGTDIATAIKIIAQGVGETMFNFDPISKEVPYEITFNAQDNRYNAIKELADLAECDIYYDVYGYLRLKKIDLNDVINSPTVWTFNYGDRFYAGNVREIDEERLANTIRVLGGSGQTATVIYDLKVDEHATQSVYYSDVEENDFNQGIKNKLIFENGLKLERTGVDFTYLEETKEQLLSGEIKDLIFEKDGLVIAPEKESGYKITDPISLKNVGKYRDSQVTWLYEYNVFKISYYKVEMRISKDNQKTWSDWKKIAFGSKIEDLKKDEDLTDVYIQFKITLERKLESEEENDENPDIKLKWFRVEIKSAYKDEGEYISNEFQYYAAVDRETKKLHLSLTGIQPKGSFIDCDIRYKINGGKWSEWIPAEDGSTIAKFKEKKRIGDFTFQYKLVFHRSPNGDTPVLKALTINADVEEFWKGNPYSIQKIGEIAYFHNNGNPDPVITLKEEAVWRAKYSLMQMLGYSEKISMDSAPIYTLDAGDVIEIYDEHNAVKGRFLIESISMPLSTELMTIQCRRQRQFIDNWNFM